MKKIVIALVLLVFLFGLGSMSMAAKKKTARPTAPKKAPIHQKALVPPPDSAEAAVTPVIKITAKRFEYSPNRIVLTKGVTTELDLTSLDAHHGFNCPDLHIRADIMPGSVEVVTVTPDKTGTFPFSCDVYCGFGHGNMTGTIVVNE